MEILQEKPSKRRNLNRWRYNRMRRLAFTCGNSRTARQQDRLTQLENLIDWSKV